MRTSERSTYQQKLGFQDPDRHNEVHNAAALYLAAPAQAEKFAKMFGCDSISCDWGKWSHSSEYQKTMLEKSLSIVVHDIKFVPLKWETRSKDKREFGGIKTYHSSGYVINSPIIQTSTTGYRNIIGYVDLEMKLPYTHETINQFRCTNFEEAVDSIQLLSWCSKTIDDKRANFRELFDKINLTYMDRSHPSPEIAVEIKHGFVDASTVIQQISTYRTFKSVAYWICATLYRVNDIYKKVLNDHGIYYIYVSPESVEAFMSAKSDAPQEAF